MWKKSLVHKTATTRVWTLTTLNKESVSTLGVYNCNKIHRKKMIHHVQQSSEVNLPFWLDQTEMNYPKYCKSRDFKWIVKLYMLKIVYLFIV
jgi:hypothetical protein